MAKWIIIVSVFLVLLITTCLVGFQKFTGRPLIDFGVMFGTEPPAADQRVYAMKRKQLDDMQLEELDLFDKILTRRLQAANDPDLAVPNSWLEDDKRDNDRIEELKDWCMTYEAKWNIQSK